MESISEIKNYKKAHDELYRRCVLILSSLKLLIPKTVDLNMDRNTQVSPLGAKDLKYAKELNNGYKKWINNFISGHKSILTKTDINLLIANRIEVSSYIFMRRRGLDVTIKMYREFYRKELKDLLTQQIAICDGVMLCRNKTKVISKKKYWQNVPLTIGVEEEYQIVSKNNGWDLTQDVDRILDAQKLLGLKVGREVYKSQIEIKTDICSSISELRKNVIYARKHLFNNLPIDLAVISAGTHPFSSWNAQKASNTARTKMFMHDMQDVVRRLVTFGLHVHIGIEDKELAIQIMNASRYFLPFLLSMSANSPFWGGRLTGLLSYRSTIFSALPRTGIPPTFYDYHEFQEYIDLMHQTRSFDSSGSNDPRKIWWDVRIHPKFPTLEFRIFDACCRVEDTICMAAICQALVAKLAKLFYYGIEFHIPKKHIIEENKWRAIRYGRGAKFIEDKTKQVVTSTYKCLQMLDFVEDVIPILKSKEEVYHVLKIAKNGTGADGQIKTFREKGNTISVVKWLANQFIK